MHAAEPSFPGLLRAFLPLTASVHGLSCVCARGERESSGASFCFYKDTSPISLGSHPYGTLIASFNLNYLLEGQISKPLQWGLRLQHTYFFGGGGGGWQKMILSLTSSFLPSHFMDVDTDIRRDVSCSSMKPGSEMSTTHISIGFFPPCHLKELNHCILSRGNFFFLRKESTFSLDGADETLTVDFPLSSSPIRPPLFCDFVIS